MEMLSRGFIIVFIAALVLAAFVGLAGPMARIGVLEPLQALRMSSTLSTPLMIAGGLSLIGLVQAFLKARENIPLAVIATAAAGVVVFFLLQMKSMVAANPFIHDLTTDFENPPAIVAAAAAPRKNPPDYVGAETAPRDEEGRTIAEAQRAAFPDIVAIYVRANLDETKAAALDAFDRMELKLLAEGPAGADEAAGWRLEAVATSFWYGFKDDFVVRLSPQDDGRMRIDMRSKSRVGTSDLGANAKRMRDFAGHMDARFSG